MKAIGVDIGTTSISLVVYEDAAGAVVEARTAENGSFLETENPWEKIQDISAIIRKAKTELAKLLKRHPDAAAIGLTGQMHGILYLNSAGTCISPLYTWQDQRGNLPGPDGTTLVERIKEKCGIFCASGYGLVTHCFQIENNLVPEGAASICTAADYLGMVLTGRRTPLLHVSMAASLGFFDVRKGEFLKEAFEEMGADGKILPPVTKEIAVLGSFQGRPVTVALGDNQASFLGAVGMRENTVLLNMGTGGQISALSKKYFAGSGIEARPFLNGAYLLVGASLCGGRAYAVLEKFFRSYVTAAGCGNQPQYEVMDKLAKGVSETKDEMKVVTTFLGTRENPDERGHIYGISEENFTPRGLILGVLDGMAQELFELYGKIQAGAGITADYMVASGNGVRKNKVLQQILAEKFGMELELAGCEEEAACGAAASSLM